MNRDTRVERAVLAAVYRSLHDEPGNAKTVLTFKTAEARDSASAMVSSVVESLDLESSITQSGDACSTIHSFHSTGMMISLSLRGQENIVQKRPANTCVWQTE